MYSQKWILISLFVYTNLNACLQNCKYWYKCMCTNYNYSYKCMFTQK